MMMMMMFRWPYTSRQQNEVFNDLENS
jgi:hypothetical protein